MKNILYEYRMYVVSNFMENVVSILIQIEVKKKEVMDLQLLL